MKKLFFSSLSIAFIVLSSCNDENNITYLDNKLIEGTWHCELKSEYDRFTIDSTVFCFDNNVTYSLYYAKVADLDTLKFEGKTEYGRYLLTDSIISFPDAPYSNRLKIRYKLQKGTIDSLFLYEPSISSRNGYARSNK